LFADLRLFEQIELYSSILEWLPQLFELPNSSGGYQFARLFFMFTLSDGGPLCLLLTLLLLFLISKRGSTIRHKKDRSTVPTTWDMQMRSFERPVKVTDDDMSPLNAHFNQVPSTSAPLSNVSHVLNHSPVASNEQINVNTTPFSYTNKAPNGEQPTSAFYDNRAFQRN
jgi:hypothetical protein